VAILPGKTVGPYQILSAIGAGGMGEVYKARDTRLDRTVAIKVLSAHLADRADLRERFDREARTIAGLNHPHICTLFDIGHQDGTDFLVMEYLEGETLADRLKKGPLPMEQVLQYAIEISDALDKAHRNGITHRDLKPGNIMLTKSGTKLLDFGLAKLQQEAKPATPFSELATIQGGETAEGTILGTLQYMAPEQVEARPVDARTDIFAFGAVVYEMATGRKAFEGRSQASLIAKILETDPPPISSLQPVTPPALDRLVKKCMAKEPEKRWQAASDVCDELKWIAEQGQGSQATMPAPSTAKLGVRERLGWLVAAVAVLVAVALAAAVFYFRRPSAELKVVHFAVASPEKQNLPLTGLGPNFFSVSPDGSKVAFVAVDASGHSQLWLRDFDSPTAQPLPGTEDAWAPFWSPESHFVAFTAGSLKKVPATGGPTETITASPADNGGTWNRDGVILFSAGPGSPILRVPSTGGSPTPVTTLDASQQALWHAWPYFLPDGKHFLYTIIASNTQNTGIYVGSLDSKDTKLIVKAHSSPLYAPPGYLFFNRVGTLLAQPFDADRLELKGDAIPIAEGIQFNAADGRAAVTVSANGVLAYRLVPSAAQNKLVWVDRKGTEEPLDAPPHAYRNPRISPDGQRVAVTIDELGSQEWLLDTKRGTLTRLTFEGSYNGALAWTPDGKRVVFGSDRAGQRNLFWQLADGSGGTERLATSDRSQVASSWSPDGQTLAFEQINPGTGYDLFVYRVGDRKVETFLQTRFNEIAPRFSPDGRWLAYASDESGRNEVYVQPYPGPGGKWQISTEGGREPVWARNGELFYRSGDKMMAVETNTKANFSADTPKVLFEGHYATYNTMPAYDVTPDGQRFLLAKTAEQGPQEISVVLNWTEELKQKAPAAK
jgi:Tol biopolymer transport system component/predicted Ser/Thr protein kinase